MGVLEEIRADLSWMSRQLGVVTAAGRRGRFWFWCWNFCSSPLWSSVVWAEEGLELSQSRMEPISSKNGKEVQWDGEVRCLFLVNDISDKSFEEGEPSEVRADPVHPAESSRGHNQERACQEGGARAGRDKSGIPAFPSSAKGDSSGWEGPQGSSDSLLHRPCR